VSVPGRCQGDNLLAQLCHWPIDMYARPGIIPPSTAMLLLLSYIHINPHGSSLLSLYSRQKESRTYVQKRPCGLVFRRGVLFSFHWHLSIVLLVVFCWMTSHWSGSARRAPDITCCFRPSEWNTRVYMRIQSQRKSLPAWQPEC